MEMNFPHDMPVPARSSAITLRKLDMDILRVLAFAPVMAPARMRQSDAPARGAGETLMVFFAGGGRADVGERGSFNPHFAAALDRLAAPDTQGESGVYHCGSVNRKSVRLLRPHAPICTNQAF